MQNRRVVLASRPQGVASLENLRLEATLFPEPGRGQVLLRTEWLSLDLYMKGRMNDVPSYALPVEIDEVMPAEVVAEVMQSRAPGLSRGDLVLAETGWQEYAAVDADAVRRLPDTGQPPSTALGVLGTPSMTAWTGSANIGKPTPGETLVVAAAAGPVGSLVGQIATLRGRRSAATSVASASPNAWTITIPRWLRNSLPPVRRESTYTGRTSAARYGKRHFPCSILLPACRSAGL